MHGCYNLYAHVTSWSASVLLHRLCFLFFFGLSSLVPFLISLKGFEIAAHEVL